MPIKTVPNVIIGSGSNRNITNNIFISDFGNTIITGYLTVDYYLTVDGNLTVGGTFDLAGNFELSGDITVKNPSDVTVFSVDSATGDTLTKGNITVKDSSDVTVFSVDSATGDTLTKGDITVKDSSDVTKFSVDSATGDTLTKGDITVKDSSDVTVFSVDSATGNTTIEGDLTVNGTTTTIDSVTLVVEDPVITLAKNANSNPTASTDAGLFLQRGSTENPAIIIWNETLNQFEVATVTGASSTTTNFTGGGVTKTFATFKSGNIYGNDMFGSSIDIVGLGAFGNISTSLISIGDHNYDTNGITLGEYGNLNIHSVQDYSSIILNHNVTSGIPSANAVIEVKRGSSTSSKITWDEGNDRWDFNFGLYLNTDSQLKMEKPTSDSTPVILLNADKTGSLQESTVVAIEVERGALTNSYIKWDETYNWWFLSNTVSTEQLKTSDIQAEVGTFNYSGGYENEDIVLYVKNTSLNNSFTITGGGDVFANGQISTNMPSLSTTPAILLNADRSSPGQESSVIALSVTRGEEISSNIKWDESNDRWDFNFGLYLNTDSQLKIEKPSSSTTPAILLNADRTGVGQEADIIAIEVERGLETNSYIKWDESNDRWEISSGLNVIGNTDFQNSVSLLSDVYIGNNATGDVTVVNSIASFNGIATFNSKLILDSSTLTISAGAVTVTKAYHKIDTEAGTATDDLDTIIGGVEGMILVLQSVISTREVVVRDTGGGTGNIRLSTASFHLDNVQDTLTLIYNGSLWCEISQSNNA